MTHYGGIFDFSSIAEKLTHLKSKTIESDFWNDTATAQSILKEINIQEAQVASWKSVIDAEENVEILLQLAQEENDETLEKDIKQAVNEFAKVLDDYELKQLLNGNDDKSDAVITIHPGAGGTESQDWAEMLYRMYGRWFERKGFKTTIIDYQLGDEAGIKDVTIEVKGDFAYGYLRSENGIHRLVRISPFDSQSRRHTSFASVFVYPLYDKEIEITIEPSDLRVDTYRASGAGGQHVNKTDSAVRLTHLPTGVVVQCQNQRSQHKNKETAMKMLKAQLYKLEQEKEQAKMDEHSSGKTEIGWGNQIRSYVFQPYTMVKDHRTKSENTNIQAVMDGDIDSFIKAYLLSKIGM